MGREDSLRAPAGWGPGSLSGRIALSGSRFPSGRPLEAANRGFRAPARRTYLSQAQAAAAPVTSEDASRLQALLGRVLAELKSRGKDTAQVEQVKAKLDHLASGAAPESIMSLTQQDIQAMEVSLQQMKAAVDWTSVAVFGTAVLLLGSAAFLLAD